MWLLSLISVENLNLVLYCSQFVTDKKQKNALYMLLYYQDDIQNRTL